MSFVQVKNCVKIFLLKCVSFMNYIWTKIMSPGAYIEICEEPAAKLKRLQYESEDRAVPIEGVRSTRTQKTFPSIRIVNYTGSATIIVSTLTADQPYRQHPHNLVGKNCKDGIYCIRDFYTDSRDPKVLSFPDLRIQRCQQWEIPLRLMERDRLNINPFPLYEFDDDMQRDIRSLRLCFQVFIRPSSERPNFQIQLQASVSKKIACSRVAAEMKIHDISDPCSPISGGKKIMIFCKNDHENIQIKLFEEDTEKNDTVIDWGNFKPHNVHRNFGNNTEILPDICRHITDYIYRNDEAIGQCTK